MLGSRCDWGEQMVPCSPGFGGAWYVVGHRDPSTGIWPSDEEVQNMTQSTRDWIKKLQNGQHNVYAGRRSNSYIRVT